MDQLREFLEAIRREDLSTGNFQGLLHILIGRRIARTEGTLVSAGMTWREAAALLKGMRWDRESVRELGLDPAALPPRDRQRYWYVAIAAANLHTEAARQAGDRLVDPLQQLGYLVGPAPGGGSGKS